MYKRQIDGGMKIFSELLAEHKAKGETQFAGSDAFKLYDTYGFPVDLTEEMVRDEGMTLDRAGFDQEMEAQRVRARKMCIRDRGYFSLWAKNSSHYRQAEFPPGH